MLDFDGVDGAALLQKNGNSLIFTDADKLEILMDYKTIPGIGNSTFSLTENINGLSSSLTGEGKRAGSVCSLYLVIGAKLQ